ncbi:MAG: hypothetical protein LBL45_05775 [Treponema sp.]|nr:hypothetical protein [Treponema sp.]
MAPGLVWNYSRGNQSNPTGASFRQVCFGGEGCASVGPLCVHAEGASFYGKKQAFSGETAERTFHNRGCPPSGSSPGAWDVSLAGRF